MEEGTHVKAEKDFESNPWSAEDPSFFLRYCCPECDYQILNLQLFSHHALENHTKSIAMFGDAKVGDEIFVKEEHLEIENNVNIHNDSNELEIETDDHSDYAQHQKEKSQKIAEDCLEREENCKIAMPRKRLQPLKKICQICNMKLSSKANLTNHMAKLHTKKEEDGEQKCDICFLDFTSELELKEHKTKNHQRNGQKSCLYCDWTTKALNVKIPNWQQLKTHIESNHHEHGEKKNLCDVCGHGFIFESSCRIHKRDRHQKNVCHICGNEYYSRDGMKDHLILAHDYKDKDSCDNVCEICGFSTPSKIKLNRHIGYKHIVERHKKCPHCDYHTPKLHLFHVHIDGKHPEHGKKQFFCDHCTKSFIFEASLKKHWENQRTMAKNRAKRLIKT